MIRFYRRNEKPYGAFSNFALGFPIVLDERVWPTTEHFFQAMKFHDFSQQEAIRAAAGPGAAAKLGRRLAPLRPDWEHVKYDFMKIAVRAKFTQHDALSTLLRSTERAELVESTTTDMIWGCGSDGTGRNWLGKILMEIRAELLATESEATPAKATP